MRTLCELRRLKLMQTNCKQKTKSQREVSLWHWCRHEPICRYLFVSSVWSHLKRWWFPFLFIHLDQFRYTWHAMGDQQGSNPDTEQSFHLHCNSGYVGLGGSVRLLRLLFQDLFFFDPASPTHQHKQAGWHRHMQLYTNTHTHTHSFLERSTLPTHWLRQPFSVSGYARKWSTF